MALAVKNPPANSGDVTDLGPICGWRRSPKEGKTIYSHLNAEFQRIARKYKKALLSDQCKEIEVNNRMGKTRDHPQEKEMQKSKMAV